MIADSTPSESFDLRPYITAVLVCAVTTVVATPLLEFLDPANIVMLFLLAVFLSALKLGRGPAVVSAFLGVALFDFFFVPPRFSFAVHDAQYLVTFAVMLAVGLMTAELTVRLQRQAGVALEGQRQSHRLYELARELAGAISLEQVGAALNKYLGERGTHADLCLLDAQGNLPGLVGGTLGLQLARMALAQSEPVPTQAIAPDGAFIVMLPLKAPMRMRGVMVVRLGDGGGDALREGRDVLMTVASLAAIAIERLHYADVAQETEVQVAAERLRSSILSALSHDLRTPLTALVGLADSLAMARVSDPGDATETAAAIRDQARAISNLVANLLDMARLQAGKIALRREWQLFEDVIGASLNLMRPSLGARTVTVDLAKDLPLVEFDAVLIERVLCNLIENAAKYSAETSPIELSAFLGEDSACIAVCDRGPGIPREEWERLFGMFARGNVESSKPGVGLGLAICRAIAEAHGGSIGARNRDGGGFCMTLRLPLGTPPRMEEEALRPEPAA